MSTFDWDSVKARYESGESPGVISKDPDTPSTRAIQYRAKREGWQIFGVRNIYRRGNAPAEKHGLTTLRRTMNELGSRIIDKRTVLGRAVMAYRADLVNALGGDGSISPQRATIIDRAVIPTAVQLSSVDAYLMELGSGIINKRHRKLYPIVKQRQEMADSLVNYLCKLGLDRQKAQAMSLDEYARLVSREDAPANSAGSQPN